MAVQVDTSPQSNATFRENGRKILRTSNGTLWVIAVQAADTVPRLRYSTDDGTNWSTSSTAFPEATNNRAAAWVFCSDGSIYMLYELTDGSAIKVRKGTLNGAHTDISWSAATTVNTAAGQSAFDLVALVSGGDTYVHVVYASNGTLCEYKKSLWPAAFGSTETLSTWSGGTAPRIEFNHTQADVTAVLGSAPDIYVSWFEDGKLMFRKSVWQAGATWTWNAERTITSDAASRDAFSMSFDGTDVVMIVESQGTADALLVLGRDAADTTTTSLANTPTRTGTSLTFTDITYNSDRGVEVFHSDFTAKVLQRVTYDRSGSSWGSWSTIDADADDLYPNVKIGYWSGSKADAVDLIWMDSTGPFIMHERFTFITTEGKVGTDSAALFEASILDVIIPFVGADSAVLSELKQLVAQLSKVDDATLTEVTQLIARAVGVDAATLSEASVLAVIEYITGSLSSTLSEQAVVDILWQLSDSATLSESASRTITYLVATLDLSSSTYTYRTFPPAEAPKLVRFGRKFLSRIEVTAGVQVYAEKVSGTWQVTTHPGTRSPVAGVDWASTDGAVDNDVRVYNGGGLQEIGSLQFSDNLAIQVALVAAGYTVTTA